MIHAIRPWPRCDGHVVWQCIRFRAAVNLSATHRSLRRFETHRGALQLRNHKLTKPICPHTSNGFRGASYYHRNTSLGLTGPSKQCVRDKLLRPYSTEKEDEGKQDSKDEKKYVQSGLQYCGEPAVTSPMLGHGAISQLVDGRLKHFVRSSMNAPKVHADADIPTAGPFCPNVSLLHCPHTRTSTRYPTSSHSPALSPPRSSAISRCTNNMLLHLHFSSMQVLQI